MQNPDNRSALEVARRSYRDISLYAPDRAPCRIDLSDNTSLFGVPPHALAALRAASEFSVTRYPSVYSGDLKTVIAEYIGVLPENVVTGCGSDDVLDSAIRAFGEPGDTLATANPSFAMVPLFARMNGLSVAEIRLTENQDVDARGFLGANADIIYLCSPNNPTGNAASPDSVATVIAGFDGVVILDEAYAEFTDRSFAREAATLPRLLVVRTLSKAFGLAGLRIGYGIGDPGLIREVEKSRGPYKVSSAAEQAAVRALSEDRDWVRRMVEEVRGNRGRFIDELRRIGLNPLSSDSNFVLVPVRNASQVARDMRERGVAVRPFPALARIGDAIRVSVGPWDMMQDALNALEFALA
jgi:histidinol-phosphate aminotransferase